VRLGDLLGQEAARTALLRAVERGHVAHAYLFEGPDGVGKRGAAYGLAMALNCDVAPGTGCGTCETCRRIAAGNHPDVQTFAPSGPGGQIVVEDSKTIVALARTRPHEAAARVLVVDQADALNPNAANGLLKTLEEPLARNHLVLCTSAADKLLPTIRSRTQRIRFRPLAEAALQRLAETRGVPADRAAVAIATADGSAARMLAAASEDDSDGLAEALTALRRAVTTPGAAPVFDFAAQLGDRDRDKDSKKDSNGKKDLAELLGLTARLYRDALAIAAGAPELAVLTDDKGPGGGAAVLSAVGAPRLGKALAAIVDTQLALTANVNPVLAFERLLFVLKRQERASA
jgi:DNA polymerase-3 subunit delta'